MQQKKNKNQTKTFVIIGGVVFLLILVLLGIYLFNSRSPQVTPTPVPASPTPTPIIFDGTYKGNTGVAGGLADVTITVTGSKMTGIAAYKGVVGGYTFSLPATISGTVSATGVVTGTISVVGNQHGMAISLSGPTNGQISGNIMNCTYAVSGDAGSYSGQISLTK